MRPGNLRNWVRRRLDRLRTFHYEWPLRADYSWALRLDICPCDADFCDYLIKRGFARRSIFHFGTGGHHVVGLRNRDSGLENEILAITASPLELSLIHI